MRSIIEQLAPKWVVRTAPKPSPELSKDPCAEPQGPVGSSLRPPVTVPVQQALKPPLQAHGIAMEDLIADLFERLDNDRFAFDGDPRRIRLRFALDAFPPYYLDALDIAAKGPLVVHLDVPWESQREGRFWFGGAKPPACLVTMGDARPSWQTSRRAQPWDKALAQVKHIVDVFHAEHWPPTNRKTAVSYLPALHAQVAERLTHLGDFCVVCAKPQDHPGIKPVPCEAPACNFSYEQMGVGAGTADLHERPAVADLLLSMAAAAASCGHAARRDHLFATAPVDFLQQRDTAPGQQVLWSELTDVFQRLPKVADMRAHEDLRSFLTQTHPHAYSLVRWVLNSWRGHLMPLAVQDNIPAMQTPHQFRVCVGSPAHEGRFAALKAQHGSSYLFHGSPLYNWHAILRDALKNCSGTALQSSGAAHGSGIYLAASSGTSASYMGASSGWPQSQFGSQPNCLALCEVINGEQSRNLGDIWVYNKEACVTLRYLFVYERFVVPYVESSALTSACAQHEADITNALAAFRDLREQAAAGTQQARRTVPTLQDRMQAHAALATGAMA